MPFIFISCTSSRHTPSLSPVSSLQQSPQLPSSVIITCSAGLFLTISSSYGQSSPASSSCLLIAEVAMSSATSRFGSVPSLKQFMLRSEVLQLYRSVCRITRPLDEVRRKEIRSHVKWEIRVVKDAHETNHIRMMLTQGRRQVEQLQQMIAKSQQ